MNTLAGKTAFVSGSGRGIGQAIARELARRGANVVVNGRTKRDGCEETAVQARALGVKALVAMGDVGDPAALRAIAEQALKEFSAVDILVNNASIRPAVKFLDMTDEQYDRVLSSNLHSAVRACRAFLPGMVARKWGRIVNMVGMNAIHGYADRAVVSVGKHGLWGLTKALAKEFGPSGVTVNCISPGSIYTSRSEELGKAYMANLISKIPLGRMGTVDDMAALAGFLCSDEGGFITAQLIASNGGAQT